MKSQTAPDWLHASWHAVEAGKYVSSQGIRKSTAGVSRALRARRNTLCALYSVWTLKRLASQAPATVLSGLAEQWGPPLWRLLFAEPSGAEFWVGAQHHACSGSRSSDGSAASLGPLAHPCAGVAVLSVHAGFHALGATRMTSISAAH